MYVSQLIHTFYTAFGTNDGELLSIISGETLFVRVKEKKYFIDLDFDCWAQVTGAGNTKQRGSTEKAITAKLMRVRADLLEGVLK
jgi:hypothetical protein